MSLKLPLRDSPLRELFDVRDVVPFGLDPTSAPLLDSLRPALLLDPAVVSVYAVCRTGEGALVLAGFSRGQDGALQSEVVWEFSS